MSDGPCRVLYSNDICKAFVEKSTRLLCAVARRRYLLEQMKRGIVIDQVLVVASPAVRADGVPTVAEQKRISERVLGVRGKTRSQLCGEMAFDRLPVLKRRTTVSMFPRENIRIRTCRHGSRSHIALVNSFRQTRTNDFAVVNVPDDARVIPLTTQPT